LATLESTHPRQRSLDPDRGAGSRSRSWSRSLSRSSSSPIVVPSW